jgi:hypothetical protein
MKRSASSRDEWLQHRDHLARLVAPRLFHSRQKAVLTDDRLT